MTDVRTLSLDATGTLMTLASPVGEVYAEHARRSGVDLAPAALAAAFRREFRAMPPMAFPGLAASALGDAERDWWRTLVLRVVGGARVIDPFEPFFARLYDDLGDPGQWRLYPDALPALRRLAAASVPVAVVSNFDSRLRDILDGLGVAGLLRCLVFSTATGAAKPDPEIFHAALAALGLPARCVLHAGDDPSADYAGARAAGLQARLVVRDPASARPAGIRCVASLTDLCAELGC
ncbi:MAG: HAD-IA family hydrolase [Gammaproteobacteria bacterium]